MVPIWGRGIRTTSRRVHICCERHLRVGSPPWLKGVRLYLREVRTLEEDTRGLDMLPRLGDPHGGLSAPHDGLRLAP